MIFSYAKQPVAHSADCLRLHYSLRTHPPEMTDMGKKQKNEKHKRSEKINKAKGKQEISPRSLSANTTPNCTHITLNQFRCKNKRIQQAAPVAPLGLYLCIPKYTQVIRSHNEKALWQKDGKNSKQRREEGKSKKKKTKQSQKNHKNRAPFSVPLISVALSPPSSFCFLLHAQSCSCSCFFEFHHIEQSLQHVFYLYHMFRLYHTLFLFLSLFCLMQSKELTNLRLELASFNNYRYICILYTGYYSKCE